MLVPAVQEAAADDVTLLCIYCLFLLSKVQALAVKPRLSVREWQQLCLAVAYEAVDAVLDQAKAGLAVESIM